MRQSKDYPPNPFRSSIPWLGLGSKNWVPTTRVQRVGAVMIGIAYILGALALIASTFFFRAELTAELHSEVAGILIGFLLVSLVLIAVALVFTLALRLLRGAHRFDRGSQAATR